MKLEILARYHESATDGPEWHAGARQWHTASTWLREGDCIAFLTREDREAIEAPRRSDVLRAEVLRLRRAIADRHSDSCSTQLGLDDAGGAATFVCDCWVSDALAGKEPPT